MTPTNPLDQAAREYVKVNSFPFNEHRELAFKAGASWGAKYREEEILRLMRYYPFMGRSDGSTPYSWSHQHADWLEAKLRENDNPVERAAPLKDPRP